MEQKSQDPNGNSDTCVLFSSLFVSSSLCATFSYSNKLSPSLSLSTSPPVIVSAGSVVPKSKAANELAQLKVTDYWRKAEGGKGFGCLVFVTQAGRRSVASSSRQDHPGSCSSRGCQGEKGTSPPLIFPDTPGNRFFVMMCQ